MERLLLRPAEVAELLGVSRSRVYELIASRALPSVRVGLTRRVPVEALRRWIEQQIQEQAPPAGDSGERSEHGR